MNNSHFRPKEINVLFVCLGNICRSPAAEGIFRTMVHSQHLNNKIGIDSAGTSGWHQGELPDERMRKHGNKRGYNFDSRSRIFTADDYGVFDYIIVMDEENYKNVVKLAPSEELKKKVHRMSDYLTKYTHSHVPDPYYGGVAGFELVMDLLEDASEQLLEAIKRDHNL